MIIGLVGTENTRNSIVTRINGLDCGNILIALDDSQEGSRLDKGLWSELARSGHVVGLAHITNRLHAHEVRKWHGHVWHILGKPSEIVPILPADVMVCLQEKTKPGRFNFSDAYGETLRRHFNRQQELKRYGR